MYGQSRIMYFVSGLTCSLLLIHPAPASLHAIVDVPGLDPASILHEFDPFRIVQIPDLRPLLKQELQMPEIPGPAIDKPIDAAPPAQRTLPTPRRSRRTLPERSLERRRLPQTELPKAESPTQRERLPGPPGS